MSIDYKYATLFDLVDELVNKVNNFYENEYDLEDPNFNDDMQRLYYETAFNYLMRIENELDKDKGFPSLENIKNRIEKVNEYTEILQRLVTKLYPSSSHVSSVAPSYRRKSS